MQDGPDGVSEDHAETDAKEDRVMAFFRNIGDALRASRQGWPGGRAMVSTRSPDPPSLQRGAFVRYVYSPSDTFNARLCMVTINGANQICRLATDANLKVAAEPTPGSGESNNTFGLSVWVLKMDNGGWLVLGPIQ